MRLLSLPLSLLLIFSSTLAGPIPSDPQTTIETVAEVVTRTVIHEVTDPTVQEVEEEGSGLVEEVAIPGQTGIIASSDTGKHCNCAPSTDSDSSTLTDAAPASDTQVTDPTVPEVEEQQTTIETVVQLVTRTVIHEVTEPSVTTRKPCKCATSTDSDSASDTQITKISGNVRMCSCDESTECRNEATKGIDTCMDECKAEFEEYGTEKTEKYLKCFTKNNKAIVEAEECLFKNFTDSCAAKNETKFIERTNWDDLTDVTYTSEADKQIKENALWKKHETKYNTIQNFFHCTKNCMHKKIQQCTSDKGCALHMPEREKFASAMNQCIKKSPKIANSILLTCQCLAWTNGVKNLQGSCAVIGNQYFIDRA